MCFGVIRLPWSPVRSLLAPHLREVTLIVISSRASCYSILYIYSVQGNYNTREHNMKSLLFCLRGLEFPKGERFTVACSSFIIGLYIGLKKA